MQTDLRGKTAIVTGGTRGIGRAIVQALLQEGVAVTLCGRDTASAERAVEELKTHGTVHGTGADVSRPEEVAALFRFSEERLGGLDVLVNNAGIGIFRTVGEMTREDWERTISVNLHGVFYCCQEALPRLRERGGGSIVNISSLAAKNAFSGGAAYNASKFALNGFSEALMLDHRHDNVRVTSVMPGSVSTEFSSGTAADWKIAPEDVADVVLHVLKMPARTTVSRVEIRPSRPQSRA